MKKFTFLVAALCATMMAFAAATAEKVTDASTLKAGDKIAIATLDGTKAMSTSQTTVEGSSYYRGVADFSAANVTTDVEQVELVASGSNFKLKVTGGYLYFDPSWSKNWLGTNEEGTDFAFEASGDTLRLKEVASGRYIMYNSDRFSCYTAGSGIRTKGGTSIYTVSGEAEEAVVENKTIAEFIANEGGKCYLTGVVGEITNTTFGNFYLTDASGTIYVYGCLTADGQSQQFETLGVEQGDTLTVLASVYEFYQSQDEAKDVIYVSHKKGSGEGEGGEEGGEVAITDVDFMMAYYYTYEEEAYWDFDIYNYDNDYPELYIEGAVATSNSSIAGTYDFEDVYGTYYTSENDSVFIESGSVTISYTGDIDSYEDPIYHVVGTLVGEDGVTYTIDVQIGTEAFDFDAYLAGTSQNDCYLTLDDEASTAIRTVEIDNTVYARDGRIYTEEGARIYSLTGLDVTRMNGNLEGIYIVKNGNKVAKVVVAK